jgi:hypothetical protein
MIMNFEKYFVNEDINSPNVVKSINNDIDSVITALNNFDRVIVTLGNGVRIESESIYEAGKVEVNDITKSFETRLKFNELFAKLEESKEKILDRLKGNEEAIETFNKYIQLKEGLLNNQLLFSLKLIKNSNKKDIVVDKFNRIHIDHVKAFIHGIVNANGIQTGWKPEGKLKMNP